MLGTSLIAWWTADRADLISLSGSAVTSWRDVKAGYDAVQAVGASRPVYSATSFNGAPSLTFDGTDDELTCTDVALLAALPDGAEEGNLFSVFQQDALAANTTTRILVSYGGNTFDLQRRLNRTSGGAANRAQSQVGNGAGGSEQATDGTVLLDTRHVARSRTTATLTGIAVDSGAETTGAVVPGTGAVRLRIGASASTSAGNFHQGKTRDVLVTGPLTSEQAALVNAWALPRRML